MQEKQLDRVLYIGGCRSGKSRLAEEYVVDNYNRPCYVATMAESEDNELQERIKLHRKRRGDSWKLIEEQTDLSSVLAHPDSDVLLIDCLSMWLTNLLLAEMTDEEIREKVDQLMLSIVQCPASVVMVSNEVGLGIVPESDLGRRFRDLAGWLNQKVAESCQRVVFVVAGLPHVLKGE